MTSWIEFYNSIEEFERKIVDSFESLCKELKPQRILEIGSGWGISTRSFLHYAPTATVVTIDKLEPKDRKGYTTNIDGREGNLQEIIGESSIEVPKLEGTFDFIYIDGSHAYDQVLTDIRNSLTKIRSGGTILLDDVLHKKNSTQEFGVMMALHQILSENLDKQWHVSILLVGHGQAMIHI